MLDIDLIKEPPHALSPQMYMNPKCGNLCAQRGRKRFIASWGLRMSHVFVPAPYALPPKGIGQSRHFALHCFSSFNLKRQDIKYKRINK
jgi:hypothetical protein